MLARHGSSPRERGTHAGVREAPLHSRIIPARAGNTSRSPTTPRGVYGSSPRERGTHSDSEATGHGHPDHPRASGEHDYQGPPSPIMIGSSPRERGTRPRIRSDAAVERIIPARAGNTRKEPLRAPRRPDHPRASGEHHTRTGSQACKHGSSPRERENTNYRDKCVVPRGGSSPRERGTLLQALCI